ncbi:MAG: discoidin domain-containing protein, partial [Ignavibacteria bacterium]|nr:discoidin domain-containing protein [Ignavibacteria bacterium]
LDELNFESTSATSNDLSQIKVIASSAFSDVKNLTDGKTETSWASDKKVKQEVILDLNGRKEFGGLKIIWGEKDFAKKFSVSISNDGKIWEKVYSAEKDNSNKSYIRLPEYETAYIKLSIEKSSRKKGFAIKELVMLSGEYSADPNRFIINIAKDYPRGYFPRYFNEEKSYWNVIGVNSDVKEALINEEGMVEVDKSNFSLEPFLYVDGKLITWNDQKTLQSLENNYLPIPKVKWLGNIQLEVKAFANGEANKSSVLYLSYTLKNVSKEEKAGSLYLALRPFQVNPYYQWLNITGGVAKVKSVKIAKNKILVNNEKVVIPISKPDGIGAASFDDGDAINFVSRDQLPPRKDVKDNTGFASAAIKYSFSLKLQEEKTFYVAVPFYNEPKALKKANAQFVQKKFEETKNFWKDKVTHIKFNLPSSADKIVNTIRTNLANILINRDKFGIQPGSRSYERSWIRDGALTSSALLKNGIVKEVREFADWYAANQFDNGKIPC